MKLWLYFLFLRVIYCQCFWNGALFKVQSPFQDSARQQLLHNEVFRFKSFIANEVTAVWYARLQNGQHASYRWATPLAIFALVNCKMGILWPYCVLMCFVRDSAMLSFTLNPVWTCTENSGHLLIDFFFFFPIVLKNCKAIWMHYLSHFPGTELYRRLSFDYDAICPSGFA